VPFELDNQQEEVSDIGPDDEDIFGMRNVIFKLRRIRRKIYERNKAGFDVASDFLRYQSEVTRFTRRFHEKLSKEELSIWSEKVLVTISDAENSKLSTSPVTISRPSKNSKNVSVNEKIISPSRNICFQRILQKFLSEVKTG
jgi:predicted component of type VI protein secretion system